MPFIRVINVRYELLSCCRLWGWGDKAQSIGAAGWSGQLINIAGTRPEHLSVEGVSGWSLQAESAYQLTLLFPS